MKHIKDEAAVVALLKEHEEYLYVLLKRQQGALERNAHRYKQESEYLRLAEHNRVFNLIKLLLRMDPETLPDHETFGDNRSF